jgi:hypothetical protein
MADTTTPLVNLSLYRIGAKPVTSISDGSPNALKASVIYPYILKLLLQQKDWRFAKLQVKLIRHTISPQKGYRNAYLLPADFLRLCMSHFPQMRGLNPIAYPPGYWYQVIDTTGYPRYYNYDPPVYPGGAPFVFEVIPGVAGPPPVPDKFCLLTDYDDTDQPIIIDYIRNITDESAFTPGFTEALICRVAQELAVPITESVQKKEDMQKDYVAALDMAGGLNELLDSVVDETGSTAWEDAGR